MKEPCIHLTKACTTITRAARMNIFYQPLQERSRAIKSSTRTITFYEPQASYRTESPQQPKVCFREAMESAPHYHRYNILPAKFIRTCRCAKEIVPLSSECNLTKFLINKLRGRAYYAVEDKPCDTITQLINLLSSHLVRQKLLTNIMVNSVQSI